MGWSEENLAVYTVIPAKAGIQNCYAVLGCGGWMDPGFRRGDEGWK
jgi:hypothetical protein